MNYYWGNSDTLVTWCEEKYNISEYISEFWNSITNIFYFIVAYKTYTPDNKLLTFYITLLGFGSFMFHLTSRYYFQILDEIPMLLILNEIVYLFYKKTRITRSPHLKSLLSSSTSMNVCIYLITRNYNFFLFVFTLNVILVLWVAINYDKGNQLYLFLSAGSMTLGKICWEIEQNYCHKFDWIYLLHGLWHLLSALSIYTIIKFSK